MMEKNKEDNISIELGVLPETWVWTSIGEVCHKPQYGWTTKADKEVGEIKLLRTTDITSGAIDWVTVPYCTEIPDDLEKYLLRAGDIVISRAGSVGVSYLLTEVEPAVFASYLIRFRPKAAVDEKYLAYYLQSPVYWEAIGASKSGIALFNVNAKKLGLVPFPLAPITHQRRIVSAIELQLGRLDAAVARLHAAKARLKRYKQAVLKSAVEGTLGTIPDAGGEATGQEILDRLLNERREKWTGRGKYKEPAAPDLAELPALPDGWAWATVEQISTKVVDGVHKKPNYVDSGVPFVTVRNLTAGPGISFESLKYITEEDHVEFIKRANPEFGDVLITKDGTLGVVRYVDTHKVFSIFVSVAMIKPVDRTMGEYLSVALSSPVVQVQMVPKGSGLQHIHLEDLRTDCVPVPPMSIQRWIVEEYSNHEARIHEMEATLDAELAQSTRLRQTLLKRAFEGNLVPTEPGDEPATELLERIKQRAETVYERTPAEKKKGAIMKKQRIEKRQLLDCFEEGIASLTPEQLMAAANFSLQEVAEFYDALHKVARQLDIVKPDGVDAYSWPQRAQVKIKLKVS
jgi:type I restriction enzyme S subunit